MNDYDNDNNNHIMSFRMLCVYVTVVLCGL